MIEQSTTLFVSEGCEPTVRVTPGACIVQVAGGDVRIVGTPEQIVKWLQRVSDAVFGALTETKAAQAEAKWNGERETRHYAAALVNEYDTILCPDGEYRTVEWVPHFEKAVFRFTDGTEWTCSLDDTVPVVIRTAERAS